MFHHKPNQASGIAIKSRLLMCVIVGLLATGCSIKSLKNGILKPPTPQSETVSAQWLESYDEALRQSAATGRPILADFTGTDWCVWCQRLSEEVFERQEFVDWATENVVLLEVDYPKHGRQSDAIKNQNAELAERYQVESYPTILLLDSAGNQLGETGYVAGGPSAWIQVAESILSQSVGNGNSSND